ncbi:MAG: hypothetical protein GX676_02900 [Bacilli bacterium]|nr:hypothetical protein [Bacilli bacterium]
MSELYDDEMIYEPLMAYKNVLKDLHHKNAEEYFEELVKKANIDVEANRETCKKIRQLTATKDHLVSTINKNNLYKALLIIGIILVIILEYAAFSYYSAVIPAALLWSSIPVGIGLIILFIILIRKISAKVKVLREEKLTIDSQLNALTQEAWNQLQPLNALFKDGMREEIFQKTLPLIKMDKMFDTKRFEYLVHKFGFNAKKDVNRSTLFVQSGEINGNPFLICKDLVHYMGTKVYTGSITITWTETHYENGKRVTRTHSQVLTASVTKPCPYYYELVYLVYGNEAAPDLVFSRDDSDAEKMSEKQIQRKVNRDIKKLQKLAEKGTAKGSNFTVMANSEFEVLFGAHNRNNEVQFRLLFTPLAQKQLLQLMKDKEIGFGDDFDFDKDKMINVIYPEHLEDFPLNIKPSYFYGYDFDEVKNKFIQYNDNYFRNIYFAFAPILAIPLYVQQKPHEYIYKGLYDGYVSFYQHEYIANLMNQTAFIHPLSRTRNILKTRLVESKDNYDRVVVTSYGYRTEERVDYVTKMGGDGRLHSIPVRWTEYIPVSQDTVVDIHIVDEDKEENREHPISARIRQLVEELRNKKAIDEKDVFIYGQFLAYINRLSKK